MTRVLAIASRVLRQLAHDKKTLILLFIAPIIAFCLFSALLGDSKYQPKVAVDNLPREYVDALVRQNVEIASTDSDTAQKLINGGEIDAILSLPADSKTMNVYLEGSRNVANTAVLSAVSKASEEFSVGSSTNLQKMINEKKEEISTAQKAIEKELTEKKKTFKKKKKTLKKLQDSAAKQQADSKETIDHATKKIVNEAAYQQKRADVAKRDAKLQLDTILADLPAEQKDGIKSNMVTLLDSIPSASSESFKELTDSLEKLLKEKDLKTIKLDDLNLDNIKLDKDIFNINLDISSYMSIQNVTTTYLHGNKDWSSFDYFGPVFIAIFIFIFAFITSCMSFVNEQKTGTMTRLQATPVKSGQILGGYSLAFGLLSCLQAIVIAGAGLMLTGFPNEGNLAYVAIIALSLAIAAVTFGLLLSGLSKNSLQAAQTMLLFAIPQILLCGLIDLSGAPKWLEVLSSCLPLTYGADAMTQVMLRDAGFPDILKDLIIIWAFAIIFLILASLCFRKKRAR